jgi:deazaflavin-dependent oxidoreductase (nitroreductase family)
MAAVRISPALRLGWRVHRWLFRISGGRIGTRMNGFGILLLTTRGRRSGAPRRVALQYLPFGDGWAVVGSRAGDSRHPDWWLNLVATPDAEVLMNGATSAVRARETEGDERAALWRQFVTVDSAYAEYEIRAMRRIPVVALEPEEASAAS